MSQPGQIEVLAPVGSFESLQAAIQGQADAIYFGIGQLNMRSRSTHNFSSENLAEICGIAHKAGLKTYLTVNTILYDQDLQEMKQLVEAALSSGVDAIIASDPAALLYASERNLKVHISTQANISNLESIRFYARFADVMVLARELTLSQVKSIAEGIEKEQICGPSGQLIRLEIFAHGALCMAVSGKCYLSLHELDASANRGACLQMCRRGYIVTEKESGTELAIENEYIMSPKDLCTIGFLDQILDTGVRVLKIEGRARSPEYVKTVTSCYKEAVSAIASGEYNEDKIKNWQIRLEKVFNRGFWDGYYLGRRLGEWSDRYGSRATTRKVYVGKVTNYFSKIGVGEFLIETKSLKPGEDIMVIGPTTGVLEQKAAEIRLEDRPMTVVKKGQTVSMLVESVVRRNDKLYKIVPVNHKDHSTSPV